MTRGVPRISPLFIAGSLMIAALMTLAACGSTATPTPAPAPTPIPAPAPAPTPDQQALLNLQKSIEGLATAQTEDLTFSEVQDIVDTVLLSAGVGEAPPAPEVQESIAPTPGAAGSVRGLSAMEVQEIVSMAISQALPAQEKSTIIFAGLNWDSAQIQNAIARYIVEEGYGYPTGIIEGGTVTLFGNLISGDADVTMEVWLPGQIAPWENAMANGDVISLGNSLDDNWQSAFVIPAYLAEANPELKSVQDLKDHLDLFEQEDGKAVLWTCIPSWSCASTNADQVVSYGLSDSLTLRDPGSQEALFGSLQDAYDKQEPWLGFVWGPSLPAATLDLTLLEEPPCGIDQQPNNGCAYPISQIRVAVHPTMVQRAPDVIEFLRRWDFTAEADVAANTYKAETGVSFDEMAIWFLQTKEDIWTTWVPRDVADRVKTSLAALAS